MESNTQKTNYLGCLESLKEPGLDIANLYLCTKTGKFYPSHHKVTLEESPFYTNDLEKIAKIVDKALRKQSSVTETQMNNIRALDKKVEYRIRDPQEVIPDTDLEIKERAKRLLQEEIVEAIVNGATYFKGIKKNPSPFPIELVLAVDSKNIHFKTYRAFGNVYMKWENNTFVENITLAKQEPPDQWAQIQVFYRFSFTLIQNQIWFRQPGVEIKALHPHYEQFCIEVAKAVNNQL